MQAAFGISYSATNQVLMFKAFTETPQKEAALHGQGNLSIDRD
jgi:hypothetical protein